MGIRFKTVIIIGILGMLSVGGIGYLNYSFSKKAAISEAKSKSQLLLNYVHSTRKYLKNVQRPLVKELIEKDRFYPELMSGFVVARGTFDIFKKDLPNYRFKQATLDPLHMENKADEDEIVLINEFRVSPTINQKEGTITKSGEQLYYIAQPIRIEDKKCLICHGDPGDAPKDQVEIYGTTNGYYWNMGDTVAAFMVYVPVQEALDAALRSTTQIVMLGGGFLAIVLVSIWLLLDRKVVAPIISLSRRTNEISLGKNLDKSIAANSKDEIGILSEAIDRLRESINVALKRSSKGRNRP